MAFEIKACSIEEVQQHPKFADRTEAKVKVTLRETDDHRDFDHHLTLRVWAFTTPEMTEADINHALLARTATILRRTMSNADRRPAPTATPQPQAALG
ncbi:hypothetical protein [Devosia sp.]|uniref:hypothetical protein n=1 Tax=Devosia sp. TaxID=1871048 RepID=UPI003A94D650